MLKGMLFRRAQEEPHKWDLLLPPLQGFSHSKQQSSLGFTPFELVYGPQLWGPLDMVMEGCEREEPTDPQLSAYVRLLRDRLQKVREVAQNHLLQAQQNLVTRVHSR